MEAIIRHSGRQFKVKKGDTINVDYLDGVENGALLELGDVLYVADPSGQILIGAPVVKGAKVLGKVLGEARGPKLIAAQFRRRKNSRRRRGHRQSYTRVVIEDIKV